MHDKLIVATALYYKARLITRDEQNQERGDSACRLVRSGNGSMSHENINKLIINSPFDKWVGRLKKYKGQRTDEFVFLALCN